MDDRFSLKGKVAVVTGANGTFGSEFCRTFAAAGADIVLAVRTYQKGEALAAQLQADYGVDTKIVQWCAQDVDTIRNLAKEAKAWKGHVDVLMCNAGGNSNTSCHHFFDRSDYDIRTTVENNLMATLFCCREFGKLMKEQGFGSIINIASIAGVIGRDRRMYHKSGGSFENLIDYAASKGGIISATRDMAAVLAPFGVRVNSISPGGIRMCSTRNWAAATLPSGTPSRNGQRNRLPNIPVCRPWIPWKKAWLPNRTRYSSAPLRRCICVRQKWRSGQAAM